MITLKRINKAIAHLDIEVVKGDGYFYFMPLDGAPLDTNIPPSVYQYRINDCSLESWLEAASIKEQ